MAAPRPCSLHFRYGECSHKAKQHIQSARIGRETDFDRCTVILAVTLSETLNSSIPKQIYAHCDNAQVPFKSPKATRPITCAVL